MSDLKLVSEEENPKVIADHTALALARDMLEEAPDMIGGFYCLIDKDDALTYDMASITKKDLLWSLVRMQNILLNGDLDD